MKGKSSRRDFLRMSGMGLGYGLFARKLPQTAVLPERMTGENPTGNTKYNVLFIAVDDLRPLLGCYGHKKIISPNIDRLAEKSTLFERAYCQQSLCAPSRSSLLSGCRPTTTKVHDLNTPLHDVMPEALTLPHHFKNHGYYAVSMGKVFHHEENDDPQAWSEPGGGPALREAPWGFKTFWPGYVSEEAKELRTRLWEESDKKRTFDNTLGRPVEAADVPDDVYPDGQLALLAISALRRLREKRFFLAVGFYKPHLAFACPKKYWDLYRRENLDLADNPFKPKGGPEIALHNWNELRAYYGIPGTGPLSDDAARELVHGYYACVSFVDEQIGRVLNELERLGLREKTIIVLWGDNGWHLGDHGLWCKHSNFESAVHTPLIVHAPGLSGRGQKTEGLVEFVDIYPSLCELSGLPLPGHLEGTSFTPLMKSPKRSWKKAAFSESQRGNTIGHSMRTDRYRYTEWGEEGQQGVELYDHQNDPEENVNIALSPESKSVAAALRKMLRDGWQAAVPEK